jgi:hypothetical protein
MSDTFATTGMNDILGLGVQPSTQTVQPKRKGNDFTSGAKDSEDAVADSLKKRKIKELPLELALLNDKDRNKFEFVLELDTNNKRKTYGKTFLVAHYIQLQSTYQFPNGKLEINKLTIDQIRSFL